MVRATNQEPNPAPATAPATVAIGFDDMGGTPALVRQTTPTADTVAVTGEPQDPDADLDARVAHLLPNQSATDWNDVSAFMAAVVPWPETQEDPGYVNLHWSFPDNKSTTVPKAHVLKGGKPYKDVADFIKGLSWRLQRPEGFKDMFFCTSMQRDHKTSPNGKRRAAKSAAAALALKSIWVDIDVKAGDPKHYHTEAEALKAILLFAKKVGLPDPSAIVRSGGGLHIYWISHGALTPQGWLPYAQGLKTLLLANDVLADTVVTTDAARILRVPGTLNHKPKYPQPMPVELVGGLPLVAYDFPKQLMFLQQFAGRTVAPSVAPAQHLIWADDPTGARDSFKNGPAAAFAKLKGEPDLNAGIGKHEDFKVNPRPIFKECGFYRDALLKAGADNDQPQWNLAILGTTFMEKGNEIAHKISSGHSTYTEADTQAMYDRKVAEQSASGIGYPSCTAIAGTGCSACAACPHFGKITSPLKLGTMGPEPNQGDGTAQQTPDAHAGSGDERLVVAKNDHMDRARIYRSKKRPNLHHYRDDYYDHEAGHYTIIDDATIRADLYEFLDHCDKEVPCKGKPTETELVSFAPNKASVSETAEALKAIGHVVPTFEQPHWLDGRAGPDPTDLICFPNGILNINSNLFTSPDPMLFTPHGVGFDYDPNAVAPIEWLNCLDQVFGGELDQIEALQEMFGYCLSSDVSQEKAFMLLGDKRSGKDTIRHTLQSLLSPTVVCGPTLDSMGTNFGMSQLIGKQLAVVGDVRLGTKCDKDLLAEHVLKLSGRGLFTIDRKHKSHWTGPLPCKLLLISNEMPKLKDASGALASRFITFRTRTSFYGREDRHLFENKIKPELPGNLALGTRWSPKNAPDGSYCRTGLLDRDTRRTGARGLSYNGIRAGVLDAECSCRRRQECHVFNVPRLCPRSRLAG
jgi:hypothetical protein